MAETTAKGAGTRPASGAFWNNRTFRAIAAQVIVVGIIALCAWYLISNTLTNLAERQIATGFGFLEREAGFGISESLIDYSPADTYGRALQVGILNTLLVAGIGIFLATIVGTVVGIARLSSNWLVRKLSSIYVELFRNTPLLLQLYFWYQLISEALPAPRQALQPFAGAFLSNRGLKLPSLHTHPAYDWVLLALAVGLLAAWAWARQARQYQIATGKIRPVLWPSVGLILGLPLVVFLAFGAPMQWDVPQLRGFNFVGGLTLSPEIITLLLGLTLYTASFIAEIVRAGIQAVAKGQVEAARALGLRPSLTLRLVVLPQALRVIVPPLTSQYLNLTKNSSLAVAIGFPDLVSIANTTMNQTGQALEGVTLLMAAYLTVSLSISAFMNWYNARIALIER